MWSSKNSTTRIFPSGNLGVGSNLSNTISCTLSMESKHTRTGIHFTKQTLSDVGDSPNLSQHKKKLTDGDLRNTTCSSCAHACSWQLVPLSLISFYLLLPLQHRIKRIAATSVTKLPVLINIILRVPVPTEPWCNIPHRRYRDLGITLSDVGAPITDIQIMTKIRCTLPPTDRTYESKICNHMRQPTSRRFYDH